MKVNVEGRGMFDISEEYLPKLLQFLASAKSVRVVEDSSILERSGGEYTGRELLNG